MSSDGNQFPRGTTSNSGNQEGRNNIFLEDTLVVAFTAILASLLNVKFSTESVFETNTATMAAILVVLQVYCVALLAKKKLVESFENYAGIIELYIHLCGILSNVLLHIMLLPVLGLIFLGIWGCCFILVTCWLLVKISARPPDARIGDNLDTESNMSANEEPNGDGFDEAPNGLIDKELNVIRTVKIVLD